MPQEIRDSYNEQEAENQDLQNTADRYSINILTVSVWNWVLIDSKKKKGYLKLKCVHSLQKVGGGGETLLQYKTANSEHYENKSFAGISLPADS
jgi:hypothetical protein